MQTVTTLLLIFVVLLVLAPNGAYAFGAGDIADFAYLNDKAFRHGDIENILANLAKTAGRQHGGGLLGFAASMITAASGGAKFSGSDIKKVYFGNWLRDYSQAMDIAGLSKLSADTIVMLISVLGFMTFGFATEEFEITADRLGVYLTVEHIDNPKGYAEKEGDARQFHPRLRPPVDPRELEIDDRTGMKNYIATENRGWDTSTAHIRRTFEKCIEYGRRAQGREGADLWEAYRLLGTGLHTMEDLLAHSNWCELGLRKMGYQEVFCHVGDNVTVNTPNGQAPPLVTGTFGSADFIHSLMGEATDHLSESSVTNLYEKMDKSGDADSNTDNLTSILSKFSLGGDGDKGQEAQDLKAKAFDFDPDKYAPKEVQDQLLSILKWRDGIYRDVVKKIEMVPGLSDVLEELTNALNAYVYTLLAPWLTPVIKQATTVLGEGSAAVINSDDQFEVFNNANASDPSHSLLSKDHFGLILNEPAGKIAMVVVEYSVKLLVESWWSNEDPNHIIDQILEAFHHPYYNVGRSQIQNEMMQHLQSWFGGLGDKGRETIEALTKDSVRNGKNKRFSDENEANQKMGGATGGFQGQGGRTEYGSSYEQNNRQGYQGGGNELRRPMQATYAGTAESNQRSSYGRNNNQEGRDGYERRSETSSYERRSQRDENREPAYDSTRRNQEYSTSGGYGRQESDSYQSRNEYSGRRGEDNEYPSRTQYGAEESTGYQPSYQQPSYRQEETRTYGSDEYSRNDDSSRIRNEDGYGGRSSGYPQEHRSRGHEQRDDESYSSRESNRYGGDNASYTSRESGQSYGDNESYRSRESGNSYGGDNQSYSSRESGTEYGEGHHGRRHHRNNDEEGNSNSGRYGSSEGYEEGNRYGRSGEDEETYGAERLRLDDNY